MRHEIALAPEASGDFKRLPARLRGIVRDALEMYLRHEPTKTSRNRIKQLRGVSKPQYRLRVEDLRIFYDVSQARVEVLAIVKKSEATTWLARAGETS